MTLFLFSNLGTTSGDSDDRCPCEILPSQAANSRMRLFDRDYPKFQFPGFTPEPGTCFIRARVTSLGLTVMCTQLLKYRGTSVTNASEKIVLATIDQVDRDIGLQFLVPKRLWWPFKPDRSKVIQAAMKSLQWIEHYPKGAAMGSDATFAIVTFDEEMRPSWEYLDAGKIAQRCRVEPAFLQIDPSDLVFRT